MAACVRHPERSGIGCCAACGRDYCASCHVDDVERELGFCSESCRELVPSGDPGGRADAWIDGLGAPIRTGWRFWLRNAGRLTVEVGLPVGLASVAIQLLAPQTPAGQLLPFAFWVLVGLCATATFLSLRYTGRKDAVWPWALRRLLPWSVAMALFFGATFLGTLLLVLPGILIGIRWFWIDEYVLAHDHGQFHAASASMRLTQGLGGRVFMFQFVLGLAEYLVLLVVFGTLAIAARFLEAWAPDAVASGLGNVLLGVLLVHAYAGARAPEVVYFYGMRALRTKMPEEELRGDWVARGLAIHAGRCSRCDAKRPPEDRDARYCASCMDSLPKAADGAPT